MGSLFSVYLPVCVFSVHLPVSVFSL